LESGALPDHARQIHAAGLRVTRPRVLVLGVLAARGGHQSADAVYQALVEQGHSPSRTTVYNVLNDLAAAEVILQADVGPGSILFEYSGEWHHHFVCRCCREVYDIPTVDVADLQVETHLPGARAEGAQVIVRGICPVCIGRL
jgi:Fe2+ or Zn2+ uptake regulation protein